jgi:glycyl-tRNA synthetase beta chain
MIEAQLNLDMLELIQHAVSGYQHNCKLENADLVGQLVTFIRERLRAWYQEQDVTPDVFAAVAALDVMNLLDFHKRVLAVQAFKKLQAAESLSAANKRVKNILDKSDTDKMNGSVDPASLVEPAEKVLAKELEIKNSEIKRFAEAGQYDAVLMQLASLREPVDEFFDKVMVMTEDEKLRKNRILLLSKLRKMFMQVADIALLQ